MSYPAFTERNKKFVSQYNKGRGLSCEAIAKLHRVETGEVISRERVRQIVKRDSKKK